MTIPALAPGMEYPHPSWCAFDTACASPDAIAHRGQDPNSVPAWRRDCHWTAPRTVSAGPHSDCSFTFECWSLCFQSPEDAQTVEAVMMTVEWSDLNVVLGVPVDVSQLGPLAEAFVELRDLADGHWGGAS